jgi:hypothetical protein
MLAATTAPSTRRIGYTIHDTGYTCASGQSRDGRTFQSTEIVPFSESKEACAHLCAVRTRDTSNNHMIGIHIRHGTLAIESVIEFGTEKSLPETAVENSHPNFGSSHGSHSHP